MVCSHHPRPYLCTINREPLNKKYKKLQLHMSPMRKKYYHNFSVKSFSQKICEIDFTEKNITMSQIFCQNDFTKNVTKSFLKMYYINFFGPDSSNNNKSSIRVHCATIIQGSSNLENGFFHSPFITITVNPYCRPLALLL